MGNSRRANHHEIEAMDAGLRTLVFLLVLQQVQAAPRTVWACEGSSQDQQSHAPESGQVCCKWTVDSDGTFTTDVRRCAPHGIRVAIDRRLGLSVPGV